MNLTQVSRDFKRLCEDNRIWKKLLRQDFEFNEDDNTKQNDKKTELRPKFKNIYAQKWIRTREENEVLKRCLITWFRIELDTLSQYITFSDQVLGCPHMKTGFLPDDFTNDIKHFGCIECNMWLHLACDKKKAADLLLQLSKGKGLPDKYKKEILGERSRISSDLK